MHLSKTPHKSSLGHTNGGTKLHHVNRYHKAINLEICDFIQTDKFRSNLKMSCISTNSVALNLPHKVPDKLKVGTLFGSNVNTSHICNRLSKGWIPNIVIIRIYDLRFSISSQNKKYFGLSWVHTCLHSRCFAVRTNTQVFCAQEQDVRLGYSDNFKNYYRHPKQPETIFPPTFKAELCTNRCSVVGLCWPKLYMLNAFLCIAI